MKNKEIDFFSMKSAAWWHRERRRDRGKERERESDRERERERGRERVTERAKSEGFVSVNARLFTKFNSPVIFTGY